MPKIMVTGVCATGWKLPCCKETIKQYELNITPELQTLRGKGPLHLYPVCRPDGYFEKLQTFPGLSTKCVDKNGNLLGMWPNCPP